MSRQASEVATGSPVASSVLVVVPSRITPWYALDHAAANGASRVARPTTWPRSAVTSTAVTVTNPTRGSRTLPVRNSATVWRIASATRSGRWLGRCFMSEKARARVHDPGAVGGLHQMVRLPQHALRVPAIGRHDARRQLGALPQVMVGRLRGRDVEAVVETVLEALQDVAP